MAVVLSTWQESTCRHRTVCGSVNEALSMLVSIDRSWAGKVMVNRRVVASRRAGTGKIVGVLPCDWDGRAASLGEVLSARPLRVGERA